MPAHTEFELIETLSLSESDAETDLQLRPHVRDATDNTEESFWDGVVPIRSAFSDFMAEDHGVALLDQQVTESLRVRSEMYTKLFEDIQRRGAIVFPMLGVAKEVTRRILVSFKFQPDRALEEDVADIVNRRFAPAINEKTVQELEKLSRDGHFIDVATMDRFGARDAVVLPCGHVSTVDAIITWCLSRKGQRAEFLSTTCIHHMCPMPFSLMYFVLQPICSRMQKSHPNHMKKVRKCIEMQLLSYWNDQFSGNRGMIGCYLKSCELEVETNHLKDTELRASAMRDGSASVACKRGHVTCGFCGNEAHAPFDCSMVEQWHKVTNSEFASVSFISLNSKRCPRCNMAVIKASGCNHLTCTCGYHFCWTCKGSMNTGDHTDYEAHIGCGIYSIDGLEFQTLTADEKMQETDQDVGNAYITDQDESFAWHNSFFILYEQYEERYNRMLGCFEAIRGSTENYTDLPDVVENLNQAVGNLQREGQNRASHRNKQKSLQLLKDRCELPEGFTEILSYDWLNTTYDRMKNSETPVLYLAYRLAVSMEWHSHNKSADPSHFLQQLGLAIREMFATAGMMKWGYAQNFAIRNSRNADSDGNCIIARLMILQDVFTEAQAVMDATLNPNVVHICQAILQLDKDTTKNAKGITEAQLDFMTKKLDELLDSEPDLGQFNIIQRGMGERTADYWYERFEDIKDRLTCSIQSNTSKFSEAADKLRNSRKSAMETLLRIMNSLED